MNVAVSRHGEDTIRALIQRFEQQFDEVYLTISGSSLKACHSLWKASHHFKAQ
jgi:hypothetical protein